MAKEETQVKEDYETFTDDDFMVDESALKWELFQYFKNFRRLTLSLATSA
jgi:hypothetical protein